MLAIWAIVGKTLAYTSATFTNSKGEIAARGSHTKSVFDTTQATVKEIWLTSPQIRGFCMEG
jgi:hypothetical protein